MKKLLSLFIVIIFIISVSFSQNTDKKEGYIFTPVKELPNTCIKNQYRSGTCWSFSTMSFVESELLRMGKGEYDLSDIFVVYYTYIDKAKNYVRYHGASNYGEGGAFHDVINMIKNHGIVPEEIYSGKTGGRVNHDHAELAATLKSIVEPVAKKEGEISQSWLDAYKAILDVYLGKIPEKFTYKGKEYTPKTYAQNIGLNPDDYVELTSYTHHPFYTKFIIEVPDNWANGEVYNLPLDEFMQVFDYAIDKGYTIAWGADISEKGFSRKECVMVVPDEDAVDSKGTDMERWAGLSKKEKEAEIYSFDKPRAEKKITQEMRQTGFDNFTTTDDHGMQIVGIAKDQNGTKYYKVKNSWGTENMKYGGYYYASDSFVRYKTMDILINKNAIPMEIRKKLGI